MGDPALDIKLKNRMLLSRNHPVALVVGGAGFIGSFLVDELLDLGVQVIVVDNLSTGKKENLAKAFKNSHLHFIEGGVESKEFLASLSDLPRLDYAFFTASGGALDTLYKQGLANFLELVNLHKTKSDQLNFEKPKICLISSISVYDSKHSNQENLLKNAEIELAKFIRKNRLNARIVRLAEVYGPRMHFREDGTLSNLIRANLEKRLFRDQVDLDFSTRALFVTDAVHLILKSVLSGSTAGKIYDGCLPNPLKASEVKELLLDPIWHERKGFALTELPPWSTPNLDRSIKELSWRPRKNLLNALKETTSFFEENQFYNSSAARISSSAYLPGERKNWQKTDRLPGWSFEGFEEGVVAKKEEHSQKRKGGWLGTLVLVGVLFGLSYPLVNFGVGAYSLPQNLQNAWMYLNSGDLTGAKKSLAWAQMNAAQLKSFNPLVNLLRNTGFYPAFLQQFNSLVEAQEKGVEGANLTLLDLERLLSEFESGIGRGGSNSNQASTGLAEAVANLSKTNVDKLPWLGGSALADATQFNRFYSLAQKEQVIDNILSDALAKNSRKNYLAVLLDESGEPGSVRQIKEVVRVKIESGRVVDLQPQDPSSPSAALVRLTEDSDFLRFSQGLASFYQEAISERMDGVLVLDMNGFAGLQKLSHGNPSLKELLNQILTAPKRDLIRYGLSLGQALEQGQLRLFFSNPVVFQSLLSQDWAGVKNNFSHRR